MLDIPFYYGIHEAPHDHYRYTEYCLRRKLEGNGFAIDELKPLGGALAAWVDLTSKCLSGLKFFGKIPAILLQKITIFINRFEIGKNLVSYGDKALPLAYFVVARKIR